MRFKQESEDVNKYERGHQTLETLIPKRKGKYITLAIGGGKHLFKMLFFLLDQRQESIVHPPAGKALFL